jgi:hypothetical protein
MNPVGLSLRLPQSLNRNDQVPVEPSTRAQQTTVAETQSAPLPVARSRAVSTQLEDQLRRYQDRVTQDGGTDARTRRALQSYDAMLSSGQSEMLSQMLGVDEYA